MNTTHEPASHDAHDRDDDLHRVLSVLDPASTRPRYWEGLHRQVVEAARFELARRRRLADLTVSGTVTSWARAVVPSALAAAAVAAAVLLTVPAPPQVVDVEMGIEELLSVGLEGDAIPLELAEDPAMGVTLAAAEIF